MGPAFFIILANGQQFGYGFKIAPDASFTDGLLDVMIVKKFPKVFGGMLALRMKQGSILKSNYTAHYHAKDVVITHPDLKLIQTDGDAHASSNDSFHYKT